MQDIYIMICLSFICSLFQTLLGLFFWFFCSHQGQFIAKLWATIFLCGSLSVVSASDLSPFPEVTFRVFADFIEDNFSSNISLATSLTVLFTMTNNTDLLNLHARQQNPTHRKERKQIISGWITALAHALEEKLGNESASRLFKKTENRNNLSADVATASLGAKLDNLSKVFL
jgi:hypothetical protein